VACIIQFIQYVWDISFETSSAQLNIYAAASMQQTVWQNVFIQTVIKIKTKDFLYLPFMESANMKLAPCSTLDSLSLQITKHVIGMPSCAKLSSESVTH